VKTKPRPIPEVLSEEEQARLLAQTSGIREQAILRLFLDTGLRAAELINLRHRDIDLVTGRLWVRLGKYQKDRGLWFNGASRAALQAWLEVKPSGNSSGTHLPSGTVFTSLDGQKPLCGRWLRKLVARLGEKAGIEKRCHPHIFRHTFGTNLLQYTKNIYLVSKALGHANLSTTMIYLHLVDGELEAAMKGMGEQKRKGAR
jgi:site-specific recombinase XerD